MPLEPMERFEIIEGIADSLEFKLMSFQDVHIFFQPYHIDISDDEIEKLDSCEALIKRYLSEVTDDKAQQLKEEIDGKHEEYLESYFEEERESKHWDQGHFRLFISHESKLATWCVNLCVALKQLGISGFVAHKDLDPGSKWQNEIELALASMDAIVAVVSEGFSSSDWCDQEIGAAIGRDKLVVPIIYPELPYGFMNKYQALRGDGDVARKLFLALARSEKTTSEICDGLVFKFKHSKSTDETMDCITLLGDCPSTYSLEEVSRLRIELLGRQDFDGKNSLLDALSRVRKKLDREQYPHSAAALDRGAAFDRGADDEVPF